MLGISVRNFAKKLNISQQSGASQDKSASYQTNLITIYRDNQSNEAIGITVV
ncbi:hypothetical protein NSP_47960 [Nodularia spumigena CCY9414]|nr:hypothetical protein NSP_47960 [Nodularia spumigena CCY9414]